MSRGEQLFIGTMWLFLAVGLGFLGAAIVFMLVAALPYSLVLIPFGLLAYYIGGKVDERGWM